MVELPTGKMKSREGTVVDADDLMEEMVKTARINSEKLGKINDLDANQAAQLFEMIGIGAIKYFILKVDPKKNMLFNPEDSIDLNGNTAPFIQYTHARICSLLRKASEQEIQFTDNQSMESIPTLEKELLKALYNYRMVIKQTSEELNPGLIANYIFEVVKLYNHFYQETPILRQEDNSLKILRLQLSGLVAKIIKHGMRLLGIDVPEKM
jgi:arginyl-tRNA synthetase